MTQDIELFDRKEESDAPPLCLVHYFGATGQSPPPPSVGHIAERDGNLLILEFAAPPKVKLGTQQGRRLGAKAYDALCVLLLLVCAVACAAAFRF